MFFYARNGIFLMIVFHKFVSGVIRVRILSSLFAQTQKYFSYFTAQTQKCLCHSKQMPDKKNNGILLASIRSYAYELLY